MTLLPPLEHPAGCGCLNCPPKPIELPLDAQPHPGFGSLDLYCDGVTPLGWDEFCDIRREDISLAEIEEAAAADPDHDWRLWINAPLGDWTYQRHGEGKWVLVAKGQGFA